jgi:ubiquinone/menaquinone biosynthesis C-methylase UbiE
MDHRETGRYWDRNADAWTQLSRAGYDISRDLMNTPAFLALLPDVAGRRGLDIGCGEGHNTRQLARRGARMAGVDIAARFIAHARQAERAEPLGIAYLVGSAVELPFPAGSFDFASAFMSLMDIPETERVVAEAYRVLRPAGFLQFSITHPCFDLPHRKKILDAAGRIVAIELAGYYEHHDGEIERWLFSAAPAEARAGLSEFQTPRFNRTLSQWINMLAAAGFVIEQAAEGRASAEAVRQHPRMADAHILPHTLIVRARKQAP